MQRFSFSSRPLLSHMGSATLRWRAPAHARRVSPFMVFPNRPVRGVSRDSFPPEPQNTATISGVEGNESGKPYIGASISPDNVIIISNNKHSAAIHGMKNIDTRVSSEVLSVKPDTFGQILNGTLFQKKIVKHTSFQKIFLMHTSCGEDQRRATDNYRREIIASDDKELTEDEGYTVNDVLAKSRHRDGSIYRGMDTWWKTNYRIANRNETRLEAMAFSDPTDCIIHNGTCLKHKPRRMLQILSLKLAKAPVDCGLIELYGYIAVRDDLDPLLNYVVNFSRCDPIVIEQGSLIYMAGPKRGIEMMDLTLIEYDLKVKTGQEKDDLQLIDGASIVGPAGLWNEPFIMCIPGEYGAVEITLSRLEGGVEATVEVLISEVQSSFDLSLSCLTSGLDKGIWLFDGSVAKSCSLKRSVVAVIVDTSIDLKFKLGSVSSNSDQHYCSSFIAKTHGHDTQEIKTALALISVRVTWSTLPSGLD